VPVKIPQKLVAICQDHGERLRWLNRLPEVVDSLQQRWSLKLEDPFDGDEVSCSWVAKAALEDGTIAILKLGMPHMEAEHEIEGLRFWAGNPTVHLLAADFELGAMLLERCEPGTTLRGLPETEQDIVIASLLRRVWRSPPAPHLFRPLAIMTANWSNEALAQAEHWRDPGVVSEGLYLFKKLPETAPAQALLATDLHAGNVLRAQREQWLAIDPKPFVGDPAYDATQHLLNCYCRLRSKPVETIRRFADLVNLDYERIRLWTFARAAVQAGENWRNDRWIELARAIGRT
jgi:streptomycin 6-kinase